MNQDKQFESRPAAFKQRLDSYRLFSFRQPRAGTRVIELIVFALILPIAGALLFPQNPLGLQSGFPWVIAGPLIFTVRYGVLWGLSCALVMAVFVNVPSGFYPGFTAQTGVLSLGTLVLCLIVGDLASATNRRYSRAEAQNKYLKHRLEAFATDYHVLKVSHGQLEEFMAGQKLSLREALQNIAPLLSDRESLARAADELMGVFSQYCSIQVAGLYQVSASGVVITRPLAVCGDMPDLSLFDPVLREALSEKELISIRHDAVKDRHHEEALLAVVPLADKQGNLHGVLAIKDMHFMAFQQDNLNVLALLGSYVGNLLSKSQLTNLSDRERFYEELETSLQFLRGQNTPAVIVSLHFKSTDAGRQVARYSSQCVRSLDTTWLSVNDHGCPVVCLLLPLMSIAAAQVFLNRLASAVQEEFDVPLLQIMQDSQFRQLNVTDTMGDCESFFANHLGAQPFSERAAAGEANGAA
ncbi:MAG: PelD GGDEF domain-containing protein [Granulosicoccus sp.]